MSSQRAYCHRKGIEYYKEIGAYPTLSTGESARAKVEGMCGRNVYAFGQKPASADESDAPILASFCILLIAGLFYLFYLNGQAKKKNTPG